MKKKITYSFSVQEIVALDEVINEYLSRYEIDLNFLDESLSKLVLFEWYKRHLSKFKFPQDQTKISLKQTEYISFLSHFRDVNHYLIDNICREIVTIITGGSIDGGLLK